MLVSFPELSELLGCVVSSDTCDTLFSQQVAPVFWNMCHYLKASHIICVPRLLDDVGTYIREKQIGRPLIFFFFFEMKNNYIAREGKIKSAYKLQWFRVLYLLRCFSPRRHH